MVLLSGPLHAATTSLARPPWDQRASLWWPDDRAWCVATDVDSMSTYVVGSRQCIAALLDDDELEVLPVSAEQTVTWDGDRLNPTPPRQDLTPALRTSARRTLTGQRGHRGSRY